MNIELVDPAVLNQAAALIAKGTGADLQEGIALLLEAKDAYAANPNASGGKNCSTLLNKALKTLHDNPFLALGVGDGAEESQVKKSYHKIALKYHPDKNKSTALLFQTALSAYNLLMDSDKRTAWEARRKKQEESLEHLRKKREEQEAKRREEASQQAASAASDNRKAGGTTDAGTAAGKPGGGRGAAAPPNPEDEADEKLREFNKKFYDEFRKAAKSGAFKQGQSSTARGDAATAEGSGFQGEGRPQAPPRPKGLRSTGRTETTVTLEWNACSGQGTIAYELQWRERGQSENQWQTAQQLLLGTTCLKKNLRAGVCYEFRTRAASAWGWSGYSDPIMVLTAGGGGASEVRKSVDASADAASTTKGGKTARAKEEASPWTWQDGQDYKAQEAQQAASPPWVCSVCKRENTGADSCSVCFAKKDYKVDKLHNITGATATTSPKANSGPPPGPPPDPPAGGHHPQGRRPGVRSASSAAEVETDDEAEAEAWEFSDRDVDDLPAQEVSDDATDGYYYEGYEQEDGGAEEAVYRLNAEVTKLHNVRAEPIKTAAIVGHLFADRDIVVQAEVGPWLKVEYHQAYAETAPRKSQVEPVGTGSGWCLKEDKGTQYLIRVGGRPASSHHHRHEQDHHGHTSKAGAFHHGATGAGDGSTTDTDGDAEYWYELTDDNGDLYYFNTATGVSQWEAPLWFDEVDPNTGATYYRNTSTGVSQWERPDDFVPVIRAESYSTPEAEFIKNMLSPTRSFRAMASKQGFNTAADPNVVL